MTSIEQAAAVVAAARAAFADAGSLKTASRQDVVDLLSQTAELARLVDAQKVRLAGEIAERSIGPAEDCICRVLGKSDPKSAVASAFGIRGRDAGGLISLAAATATAVSLTGESIAIKYPRVADALDAGELSLAQARAIVGTLEPAAPRADLDQLAWAEGCLVDAATDPEMPLVPELLVTQARAYVAVLDPDGILSDSERQRTMRSLRMRRRPDGMWLLTMTCTPEAASAIKALLDAYTSPRVRVVFNDDDPETEVADDEASTADEPNTGTDEPSVETDEPAVGNDQPEPDEAPVDDRTRPQKQHDVIEALAVAHVASGGAPVAGGEVPRLVFNGTIEAFDAYVRGLEHPDRALRIEHTGEIVPIETADRLVCEAVVQRAVVDAKGQVLELGREKRLFSKPQRRALAVTYGGCATSDCNMPVAWTETHHVVWWDHGGKTDVGYGILLCSHCHHEVHAGRLQVVGTKGNWRVVPVLRPSNRYARTTRKAARVATTAACAAPASLAVKLADEAQPRIGEGIGGPGAPSARVRPAPAVRRPRRRVESIEQRLRRRLGTSRPPDKRTAAIDFYPPPRLVMRT
ncbi:HNH endonuclease [Agrococcus baldri]|uniref:HNH endonuclease n=1 Tax=Agrococcus baldri TaxID=153730 RepID=A0AA94HMW1_9MICO|nr:HNH endonuclease signature motif containing protein [Agrococcus baldri]SFS11120.1 HNH endonuclease [Agrococcus baldri]